MFKANQIPNFTLDLTEKTPRFGLAAENELGNKGKESHRNIGPSPLETKK